MNKYFLPRYELYKKFEDELRNSQTLYVFGHVGWGKTSAVLDWLERTGQSYFYIDSSAVLIGERLTEMPAENHYVIVDEMHQLSDESGIQALQQHMQENPSLQYILIGNGGLPKWLKAFMVKGNVELVGPEFLGISKSELQQLTDIFHVKLTEGQQDEILKITSGWILAITLLLRRMKGGTPYSEGIYEQCNEDLFDFFDLEIMSKFSQDVRNFFFSMAAFPNFSTELAQVVCMREDIRKVIMDALNCSSAIQITGKDSYSLHPFFTEYLQNRQKRQMNPDKFIRLYQRGAEYYRSQGDHIKALHYYQVVADYSNVCKILIEESKKNPGTTDYYALEPYYLELPEHLVLQSPELMSGLSMLHSLCFRLDKSEYWLKRLEAYYKDTPKKSPGSKEALECLVYLRIALPHRGISGMKDYLLTAAQICLKNGIQIPALAISGNSPSLVNGGKDFSKWSKNDKTLHRMLKRPCEFFMGKSGVGFADVMLAESLYEKSTSGDLTGIMTLLNTALADIQSRGNLDIQFAAYGVMSRLLAAQGHLDVAESMLENLETAAKKSGAEQLIPNMRALRVRQQLLRGETAYALEWLVKEAPNENYSLHIMDRYLYMTKVRVYISQQRYSEAKVLLQKMQAYYKQYLRPYGVMETQMFYALVLFREGNRQYQSAMNQALAFCQEYQFLRPVADEGKPILDMLQNMKKKLDPDFYKKLILETESQSRLYEHYLEYQGAQELSLTTSEQEVLALLVKGYNNVKIAEILNISVSTVKFHASNIYVKLGVKNRTQAAQRANEWNLVK